MNYLRMHLVSHISLTRAVYKSLFFQLINIVRFPVCFNRVFTITNDSVNWYFVILNILSTDLRNLPFPRCQNVNFRNVFVST